MKRMKRKALTLSMAVVMATSLLAGCAGNEPNSETNSNGGKASNKSEATKEPAKEPVKISYWTELHANASSSVKSLADVEMYKELEKRTGVQVAFQHPPQGQTKEQFSLLIAGNDLPDVVEYNWGTYPGGGTKALSDGVIIKLNDLINEHAPNLKKILDENPEVVKQLDTDDGSIFAFPALNLGKLRVFGGMIIRQDWLDELGLQQPETIEEWETVLRAFKEKKGATAPFTFKHDEIGFNDAFLEAFGITKEVYLDNGKVKVGSIEPQYKEFLELFQRWYKEGLIDVDFATNDAKAMDANITTGKTGAFYGYIGGSIGKFMGAMKESVPNVNLAAVQYPVLNKGDEPKFIRFDWEVNSFGLAAITSTAKDPVAIVKWLDYLYSDEGHMLKNFGLEGKTYTMVNGYPTYTDIILKNPDNLTPAQAMAKYFRANYPSPGVADDRYNEQYYELQQQKDALKVWPKYIVNAQKTEYPPAAAMTQSEAEEAAKIWNDVKTYVAEMNIKFIMGAEPISNFDKFVEQQEKMNINRYIELKQVAYDRFANAK